MFVDHLLIESAARFQKWTPKVDVENKETVQYEGCSQVWSTIDQHALDWWKVNEEHRSHRRESLQTVLESKTPAYAFAAHFKKSNICK